MKAAALALTALLGFGGCSKKDAPPRRTEPWLANPSASGTAATSSAPQSFHFTPESSIRFSVPGKKAKVSGRVPLSEGSLRVDTRDLKNASASIDVDLTKLSLDPETIPESVELGGAPDAVALQWLELGIGVAPERRRELSVARFELSSIETLSTPFLDFSARSKSQVRASVVGTLLIHGFRAPIRGEVLVKALESAPGAAKRLSIRSASALVVALAPHDVSARGPSGIADALAMARASDWIGKNARIEFELLAEADVDK
jgi:hypothetical protein